MQSCWQRLCAVTLAFGASECACRRWSVGSWVLGPEGLAKPPGGEHLPHALASPDNASSSSAAGSSSIGSAGSSSVERGRLLAGFPFAFAFALRFDAPGRAWLPPPPPIVVHKGHN